MVVGVVIYFMVVVVNQCDFYILFFQCSIVIIVSYYDVDGVCLGGLCDQTLGGGIGK